HDAGDAVLREFAGRLKRNIRGVDLACRFGGEEFVVLMPDTDPEQAEAVAERVRQAMAERPFEIGLTRPLSITISIGVALNESLADTPESLLKRADVALYRAKRGGRNRVILDAASPAARKRRPLGLAVIINKRLSGRNGRFCLRLSRAGIGSPQDGNGR